MTLAQALGLVQQGKEITRRRKIFLVCGFQPLHLATFVQAYFALRFPGEAADIETGLYGDLDRTLGVAAESDAEAVGFVIEWADLDPRLGIRSTGGWALSIQPDIVDSCRDRFARLLEFVERVAPKIPLVLVPPTLPFALFGHTSRWQLSVNELQLQKQLATFLMEAGRIRGVSVLNAAALATVSPASSRSDVLMELKAGFPYTLVHASAVASQLVQLLYPPTPMKGLITDLDETLWSGIIGETGTPGVSWSLTEHAQIHGLYQQMLRHLSEMGALLAVASKNELSVVEAALRCEDLLVPPKSLFPVLADWGSKSESVAEILRIWNIGPESVVFVDDSPMEIEEVRTAFPTIRCLQFSKKEPAKMIELLEQLRDLFGKSAIYREDYLRQASIRVNAALQAKDGKPFNTDFLRGLKGQVIFDSKKDPSNTRLLELINKTNQFNLNGVRFAHGEWLKHLEDESTLVVGVSYKDKFGPLGVIGVLFGRQSNDELELVSWVISCRAFSRKIEDHMLDYLFNQRRFVSLRLDFRATPRNQPLQKYMASLGLDASTCSETSLTRGEFKNNPKDLPHKVRLQD